MIQGIHYDNLNKRYTIRELEVSITNKCNLACDHCGFHVPHQPSPAIENTISELSEALQHLKRLNVWVDSIAIMGGESTLYSNLLEETLAAVSAIGNCGRIEVVTNGLIPKGLSIKALKYINRLSISQYFEDTELVSLWKRWVKTVAPHVELIFRTHKDGWDQWFGEKVVSDEEAQEMFTACWYRKHCVTIERKKLFLCSRIPKLEADDEGIAINHDTTIDHILAYLNRKDFLPSCKACIPMMGLPKVEPGMQPDNRIDISISKAANYLKTNLEKYEKA